MGILSFAVGRRESASSNTGDRSDCGGLRLVNADQGDRTGSQANSSLTVEYLTKFLGGGR